MASDFHPLDLFELSKNISKDSNYLKQARYRTSLNRAYFSAFLLVYSYYANHTGFQIKNKSQVHREVRERFKEDSPKVSNYLEKLHESYRVPADYYIDENITISMLNTSKQITERIINYINEKMV